jgi:hypothetical protein
MQPVSAPRGILDLRLPSRHGLAGVSGGDQAVNGAVQPGGPGPPSAPGAFPGPRRPARGEEPGAQGQQGRGHGAAGARLLLDGPGRARGQPTGAAEWRVQIQAAPAGRDDVPPCTASLVVAPATGSRGPPLRATLLRAVHAETQPLVLPPDTWVQRLTGAWHENQPTSDDRGAAGPV